jgi:predicted CXXCH cytochrome family protein
MSHPFNIAKINPRVAAVPASALREGVFECVGCHDPHPSNPNYRYLTVNTNGGSNMNRFCSVCHSVKVDPKNVNAQPLFSSMDQREAAAK